MLNSLTGTIPSELGLLSSKLTFLSLAFNSLSGKLPSELGMLSEAIELSFWSNELTGTIPIELFNSNFAHLLNLDVSQNKFHGSIPSEVGLLSSIQYLYFRELPSLEGTIPSEVGLLTNLFKVHFDGTSLHGSIPTELCGLNIDVLKADCDPISDDNETIPVTCPEGCCTKCCRRESGICRKIP